MEARASYKEANKWYSMEKGKKEEKLAGDSFQTEFYSWEWGDIREFSG